MRSAEAPDSPSPTQAQAPRSSSHSSRLIVSLRFFSLAFCLAWVLGWTVQYCRIEIPRLFSSSLQSLSFWGNGYEGFPWAVMGALAFLALFAGAVAQIGGWISGRLRITAITAPDNPARRFYALEEWTLNFVLGTLVVGLVVLGLGLAGVGFPASLFPVLIALSAPFWIVLVFALLMAIRAAALGKIFGNFTQRLPRPAPEKGGLHSLIARSLFWASALLIAFGLLYALTPPIQSDGLRYHLAAPQEYLKARRIGYLPYSAFSNFPFLIEMLFTLALAAGSDLAAKGIHWLLLVVSVLWIWLLTARLGLWRVGERGGR
ncbi:MAG: hypothetical protein NTX50_14890, partial [Candidatus Sumerlaeota bacterium]|nr:hypothetical protein [Candidatus Sumerlaeota bacterium]